MYSQEIKESVKEKLGASILTILEAKMGIEEVVIKSKGNSYQDPFTSTQLSSRSTLLWVL